MRVAIAGALLAFMLTLAPSAAQDDNASRVVALFFREPNWRNWEACRQLILGGQPMDVMEAALKFVSGEEFQGKDDRYRKSRIVDLRWLLGNAGATEVVTRMVDQVARPGMDAWTMPHFRHAERWNMPSFYVPLSLYDRMTAIGAPKYGACFLKYAHSQERAVDGRDETEVALYMMRDFPKAKETRSSVETAHARLSAAEETLRIDPTRSHCLAWVIAGRGDLLMASERWHGAAVAYSEALELAPGMVGVYQLRAEAYRKLGKQTEVGQDESRAERLLRAGILRWARGEILEEEASSAVWEHFASTAFGGYCESHSWGFCRWVTANATEEVLGQCDTRPVGTGYGQGPAKIRGLLGPAGQHHMVVRALQFAVSTGVRDICAQASEAIPAYLQTTEDAPSPEAYVPVTLHADMALKTDLDCRRHLHPPVRRICADAIAAKGQGDMERAQGLFTEALGECETLARQPHADPVKRAAMAKAFAACGEAHAVWEQWQEAAAFYTNAIETEPELIWAYRMRAEALDKLGQRQRARIDRAEAHRLLVASVREWGAQGNPSRLVGNVLAQCKG